MAFLFRWHIDRFYLHYKHCFIQYESYFSLRNSFSVETLFILNKVNVIKFMISIWIDVTTSKYITPHSLLRIFDVFRNGTTSQFRLTVTTFSFITAITPSIHCSFSVTLWTCNALRVIAFHSVHKLVIVNLISVKIMFYYLKTCKNRTQTAQRNSATKMWLKTSMNIHYQLFVEQRTMSELSYIELFEREFD